MRRTTALIVGGGPAGSAASILLARRGVATEVIERSKGAHDVVCGGFLGWDALDALEELGVDALSLGAHPITHLRLVSGRQSVEVALPRRAAGLSRRTLDDALLFASTTAGTTISRGKAVRALDPNTLSIRTDDGQELTGDALFLATGKHELRGTERPSRRTSDGAVGLRTTLAPSINTNDLHGIIELHIFEGGYAGLLIQEDGHANLCLSVTKRSFADAGGIEPLIAGLGEKAPLLSDRLSGHAGEWRAVAGVPYGWRAKATSPGLFRLGDQAAVVSSLAGDGVAIALTSGIWAARSFLRNGRQGSMSYQRGFARSALLPLTMADLVRHSAERHSSTRFLLMRASATPGLASLVTRLTRIA